MTKLAEMGVDNQVELGMRLASWFQSRPDLSGPVTVDRLQAAFRVSRATAYRYIAAYRRCHKPSP